MNRLSCAIVLASGLSVLSGCQSGPLARLSGSNGAAAVASNVPDAAVDIDPRVAAAEGQRRFGKSPISKEYTAAKQELKDPENLMQKMAEWQIAVADSQNKPAALEKARQTYAMLLADNPRSVDAMLGLARVDYKADRIADAERMYKTVATKFPENSTALAAVADFYNRTDRAPQALRLLTEAVQKNPEDRGLRTQMGLALVRTGQPEKAVPHFTKVDGQATAYAMIGNLLAEQKDFAGAEAYLQRAIDRNPELEEARTALAQINKSMGGVRQVAGNKLQGAARRVRQASTISFDGDAK